MAVTRSDLKSRRQDYLLAYHENDELVMEPFCSCGNALGEDYICGECKRQCDCNFIACADPGALSIVEKLIAGHPNFKKFTASLLDQ